MPKAQVHRFGDTVAAYLGNGATVYLTPANARDLAHELSKCANDCESRRYQNSLYDGVELPLSDTGYNGNDFKIERP